ncbi:hypothetical protein GCM10020221_15600 [Streptomyces thioluteus]|uniref:Uncharacterized protein n=1 Tax=Streptomyces thioluteus TaxID=66431 RepID=A0ABN3WM84_STRTU
MVKGKQGYLTMELPDAYGILTQDHPVRATIRGEAKDTVVNAPKNEYTPLGEAGDRREALRAAGDSSDWLIWTSGIGIAPLN